MQLQSVGMQNQTTNYSKPKNPNFGTMHCDEATAMAIGELCTGKLGKESLSLWDTALSTINNLKIKKPGKAPADFDFYVHVAENGEFKYTLGSKNEGPDYLLYSPEFPFHNYSAKMQEKFRGKTQLEQFVLMCTEAPKQIIEKILSTNKAAGELIFAKCNTKPGSVIAATEAPATKAVQGAAQEAPRTNIGTESSRQYF